MRCQQCGATIDNKFKFCPECGVKNVIAIAESYKDAYGVWEVTTEGDVEGRTVTKLGTHKGYIDEIAFALADQCYYSLTFHRVSALDFSKPSKKKEVNITLSIDSRTWDMNSRDRTKYIGEVFKDRPVKVEESNYYASVKLVRKEDI